MVNSVSIEKFKLKFLQTTPYISWLKKFENIRYIGRGELFRKITVAGVRNYVQKNIKSKTNYMYLIKNQDGFPIGTAKIGNIDWYHKRGDIGIMIDREYGGCGYGSQTVSLLVDFGFSKLGLNKITGGCECRNIAMKKVFKNNGFKLEGVLKKNTYSHSLGKFVDQAIFGIIKLK